MDIFGDVNSIFSESFESDALQSNPPKGWSGNGWTVKTALKNFDGSADDFSSADGSQLIEGKGSSAISRSINLAGYENTDLALSILANDGGGKDTTLEKGDFLRVDYAFGDNTPNSSDWKTAISAEGDIVTGNSMMQLTSKDTLINPGGENTMWIRIRQDVNQSTESFAVDQVMVVSNALNNDDNANPVATDDTASTTQDTPVEINVLTNDSDSDGDSLILSIITSPTNGDVVISDNDSPNNLMDDFIIYTPNAGFRGNDSFVYQIDDGKGGISKATVNITVETPAPVETPIPGATLWSELNIGANEQVVIGQGETVILDRDTANLAGVIVEGKLIFSENFTDTNGNGELDFTADWLLVRNGGYLEIGTEDDPYNADTTITLDGVDEDVMNMGMGGRFIITTGPAVDGTESRLSMHGIDGKKVSWTQLSANAEMGDNVITLADSVNWEVGDKIVIAPSGFDANEAEKRTIIDVNGNKVTLDKPLSYEHFGQKEIIGGKEFDMRAEVGLLSRNIAIQGAEDSLETEFGTHLMFMDGSSVQISGIEIRRGGQIRKEGRYPIHWHLGGDRSGDYIKDSSIYDSFQRGIVLHGVENVEVNSNVVYNVFGHGYVFSEDGNEWNNRLTNNLGILIKNRESSDDFSFPANTQGGSSQAEHRSAVFWGRNYYNPMIGNHAAGTLDGNGFHIDLRNMNGTFKSQIKNSNEPIIFIDNVAHSNNRDRLKLSNYSPVASGNGLMLEKFNGKGTTDIVFENFTTYKNTVGGVWLEDSRHVLQDAMIADSSSGLIVRDAVVKDAVITHQSSNSIGGIYGVDKGLVLDGAAHVLLGKVKPSWWDIKFVNTVGLSVFIERDARLKEGSVVNGIEFIGNTPQPLYWDGKKSDANTNPGILVDLDGSLLGTNIATNITGPFAQGINPKFFNEELNAYVFPA